MNKIVTAGLVALIGFGLAPIANAQYEGTNNFSVRAGAFFPSDRDARNQSNTWFTIGVEFRLGELNLGMEQDPASQSFYSVSADYYGSGDFSAVPILVNYIGHTNQFYYTVGAGVAFSRQPVIGGTSDKAEFAYQLGVGYDFAESATPFFAEARYFGNANSRLNGFALTVGIRF